MNSKDKIYVYCQQCKVCTYHTKLNIFENRLKTFSLQSDENYTFEHPFSYSHECLSCGIRAKIDIFEF